MKKIDYEDFVTDFSPESIVQEFEGDFELGINICEEMCDRWAGDESRVALRYELADGTVGDMTFRTLMKRSAQFANFLNSCGVGKGDRIAALLTRTPELMIVVLGTLRAGAVYQPMFTAFGSGAIEYRVNIAETRLIVTNPDQWSKLMDIKGLPKTMLVADRGHPLSDFADFTFLHALSEQSDRFEPVLIGPEEPFLLMFTSGTTGTPKGVEVPAKAISAFYVYMKYAIGLRSQDRFWNMADPGWAYGLYYGVVGPLLLGCATHFSEDSFTPKNTFEFLHKYRITNLAAAPTVYRLLKANEAMLKDNQKTYLRAANSAGEPLNPEIVNWMRRVFGCLVCDQYGQTETGMTSANFHELEHPFRNGSMGYALPGIRLLVLDADFNEVRPGESGELAIDIDNSPLYFFQGYKWSEISPIKGKYYLTGDVVVSHGDGSYSYTGRDDDLITSAGYRIGPTDVESTLLEHDAVVESAVVGKPDKDRGFIVKAYVVIQPNIDADNALSEALQQHVRTRLSAHAVPREVEFVDELPKTSSGKIMRYVLRQEADKTP